MKNFKKIMALIIAAVMIVSTMSVTAFAADTVDRKISVSNLEKDDKVTFDVAINNGVEWWAIDGFNADPMALRYLVTAVYTRFLKKYTA